MLNKENFILRTDSYKLTHWKQYPEGMTKVYSYLEARGGEFEKTMFFGLQYYVKKYLENVNITMDDVDEAEYFSELHFGTKENYNRKGWEYIVKRLGGRLPIRIKAVKEGSLVPVSNVLATIENTDPSCYWLTNVIETLLLKLWYPITVSSNSYYAKKTIKEYLQKTGGVTSGLLFKLHDFGYRGVSSEETAGIGGMSHLVNFNGTDTIRGIVFADNYYDSGVCGFSVPASEHSVACSFGKDFEDEYFLNMLSTYNTGVVSIVSDTYDVFNFITTMSERYRKLIISREGTVVFRPDSGDPVEINSKLIDILWDKFGGEYVNGFKVLVPQVRLIQGDGIDRKKLEEILHMLELKGFSADNIIFGSGGGLLQKFDRDTCQFAIKASYGEREVDGKIIRFAISKDPITSKSKKSKPGILKLHKSGNKFTTLSSFDDDNEMFTMYTDELEIVFENGFIKREQTFSEIKELAEIYLEQECEKPIFV